MKSKIWLASSLVFFLIVNTHYFWIGILGVYSLIAYLILFVIFITLFVILGWHIYLSIRNNFNNNQHLILIATMLTILTSAAFRPFGLINFQNFEGKELLTAKREGVANCMTTLKLMESKKFIDKSVCFGITEIRGDYSVNGDTIFFKNIKPRRQEQGYYKLAIISYANSKNRNILEELKRYRSLNDTIPNVLIVIKNELIN